MWIYQSRLFPLYLIGFPKEMFCFQQYFSQAPTQTNSYIYESKNNLQA